MIEKNSEGKSKKVRLEQKAVFRKQALAKVFRSFLCEIKIEVTKGKKDPNKKKTEFSWKPHD